MSKLLLAALAAGTLVLGACGKDKPATDGGGGSGGSNDGGGGAQPPVNVMVSGTAAPHALTHALDPTADFSMLTISVVDPSAELAGATMPLATAPLETTAANCGGAGATDGGADGSAADGGGSDAAAGGGTGCAWSFPTVDISKISLGLVVKLEDMRATGKLWVKTGTGAGTGAFISMEKTSKAPITGRQAFMISRATQDKLAMLVSAVLSAGDAGAVTLSGDQLEARGYMIGHVTGKLSTGAMPVAGATITAAGAAAGQVDIIYPNATFNGAGAATASHGIFLVVPHMEATPGSHVTIWTVKPPSTATDTWSTYTAGTQPGAAFVIIMAANE
jgi:hypothetical protein